MPEENKKASEELIDVGETEGAEIKFDSKGEPEKQEVCLLYTSPSPRDRQKSRMPSSA